MIKFKHIHHSLSSSSPYGNWVPNLETGMWEAPTPKPDSGMWMWTGEGWEEQQYDPSYTYIVCGYPRSGNTYLNHYLSLTYGTGGRKFVGNWHTVDKLENNPTKVLVSIRNPLDCISSWANYQLTLFNLDLTEVTEASVEDDMNYYLRFMQAVLDNRENVVLFDFAEFTTDLSYVDAIIAAETPLTKRQNASDEDVKNAMNENQRQKNLPEDNDLSAIKTMVQNNPKYADCVALYNAVKES
jgi:hypothetical protein